MIRFALSLIFIVISVSSGFALTITVGGNTEETAVRTDQITVDMCAHVYDCSAVRQVSVEGKAGLVASSVPDTTNLRAVFAPKSDKSRYSEFTDKASWGEAAHSNQTQLIRAFSSSWVNNQLADKVYYSPLALGGDSAPSAEQALLIDYDAGVLEKLKATEYYSTADDAAAAYATSHAGKCDSCGILDQADKAVNWEYTDRKTRY